MSVALLTVVALLWGAQSSLAVPTVLNTFASSATVGAAVHDVATLSGVTAGAGGTVTFRVWGPSSSPDCSGAPSYTSTVNVSGPGDYNSGNYTPATAGGYYWVVSYSGDVDNASASGACGDAGETSTLDRQVTLLSSAATPLVNVGGAVHDVATLSGATAGAAGTVTFRVWGPSSSPDCSGAPSYTSTVNVSGPGDYNSGNYTPATAGGYYWVVSYSGDTNNLPSTGACGVASETSTLDRQVTLLSSVATPLVNVGAAVHDVATLSGATAGAGGSITFQVWGPSDTPDCSGAPAFTGTVAVSGPGDYASADVTPGTAGRYYWIASYSGDTNNLPSTGACGVASEVSGIAMVTPAIGTSATSGIVGDALHDVATLSGGHSPTGTITFTVYGPSADADCSGTAVFTDAMPVNGSGGYTSSGFAPTTAGDYYWTVSYSGDVNNLAVHAPCGSPDQTSAVAAARVSSGAAPTPSTTPTTSTTPKPASPATSTNGALASTGVPVEQGLELVFVLLTLGVGLLVVGARQRSARH